jgi:hypothetical protein
MSQRVILNGFCPGMEYQGHGSLLYWKNSAAHYTPEESRYDERLRWDNLIQILSRFWITSTTSGGNQMLFRSSAIFSGG